MSELDKLLSCVIKQDRIEPWKETSGFNRCKTRLEYEKYLAPFYTAIYSTAGVSVPDIALLDMRDIIDTLMKDKNETHT